MGGRKERSGARKLLGELFACSHRSLAEGTRTGSSDKTKELDAERERARQIDEERLNEALGIKPIRGGEDRGGGGGGRGGGGTHSLNDAELKQLLSRGSTERSALDGERVAGLGGKHRCADAYI